MSERPMLDLLQAGAWGEWQPSFDALSAWPYYSLLLDSLARLNHDALYASRVHGLGHIERTMLQGGFCALSEELDATDTQLLLEACAYHDVGRGSDWEDTLHGHRSAQRIAALTGRSGEELLLLQGAVDAHSRRDAVLQETLDGYGAQDKDRALLLALLLKDADGLDRVRLGDLDPKYLRRPASRERAGLAQAVFDRYQAYIGEPPGPFLTQEQIAHMRSVIRARKEQEGKMP